jgi:16S rRNA C1402 (ribose-2'-O) methylase RsmI
MIYIVPTPIGNLDDITVRGIKILSKAKVILCEDGKITSKLLNLLKIDNKPKYINLVRSNKFNESGIKLILCEIYGEEIFRGKTYQINNALGSNSPLEGWQAKPDGVDRSDVAEVGKLPLDKGLAAEGWCKQVLPAVASAQGADWGLNNDKLQFKYSIQKPLIIKNPTDLKTDHNIIAIVTDAGTPGISDPAFEIIKLLQELNLDYTVLPGATACIPAIVTSNLVSKEFLFQGFLPLKKGRQTIWKEISQAKYPVVIYESCHRINKLIEELKYNLKQEAQISISQEISKKHENTWIGNVNQLPQYPVKDKGEFVVVIKN